MKFPALMYHAIPVNGVLTKFDVPYENFERQIDYIVAHDYKSINLNTPLEIDKDKSVLITFDDGHESNLRAAKYLSERGLVGVFYIVREFSEKHSEYLKPEQIRQLVEMGHVVGIHGKDHDWWTKKSPKVLLDELTETKKWLERVTGHKVITCSAPGGRINRSIVRLLRQNIPELKYIRDSAPCFSDISGTLHAVAMKSQTTVRDLYSMLRGGRVYYARERLVYFLKECVKKIVY